MWLLCNYDKGLTSATNYTDSRMLQVNCFHLYRIYIYIYIYIYICVCVCVCVCVWVCVRACVRACVSYKNGQSYPCILFLWSASCCVAYMFTSQICPRSQLIIFISLFYCVCSLHLSAPTGHPEVKHNIIIYYVYENYHTTAYPLFFLNYSPIWCTSPIIYLSIYNHIMVIVSIKWIQYIYKLKSNKVR
jgi:hypothetical protein